MTTPSQIDVQVKRVRAIGLTVIPFLYEDALNYQIGCIWHRHDGSEIASRN